MKILKIALLLPALLIMLLALDYWWDRLLPYYADEFDALEITTLDFSRGGPLQESHWQSIGKLTAPVPADWVACEYAGEFEYHAERFRELYPDFAVNDMSCYRPGPPGWHAHLLLHRPTNTVYLNMWK